MESETMRDDLATRLRGAGRLIDSAADHATVYEAADAIERLTREWDTKAAMLETTQRKYNEWFERAITAEAALATAREAMQPIANLVAMTADGFPDHDLCPIRLGQARAIAAALAALPPAQEKK